MPFRFTFAITKIFIFCSSFLDLYVRVYVCQPRYIYTQRQNYVYTFFFLLDDQARLGWVCQVCNGRE